MMQCWPGSQLLNMALKEQRIPKKSWPKAPTRPKKPKLPSIHADGEDDEPDEEENNVDDDV